MASGSYEIYRNGKKVKAGYLIAAMCEQPGCNEKIDRGLAYLCGEQPGGDENGCGGYFCGHHLYMAPEGQDGSRCILCRDRGDDPLSDSPDAMRVTFA